MSQKPLGNLSIHIEYTAQLNWSLLRAGIPFIFKLEISSASNLPQDLTFNLSVPPYLQETEIHVSAQSILERRDLSGDILPLLVNRWKWLKAWDIDVQKKSALEIKLPGYPTICCPLDILNPAFWRRVISTPTRIGTFIPLQHATISISGSEPHLSLQGRAIDLDDDKFPYPPMEAAIAALIDPNDPYVQLDGQEDSLGKNVYMRIKDIRVEENRTQFRDPTLDEILKGFYLTLLRKENLWHIDFLHSYDHNHQAIRLLKTDRDRGAVCLDLVILGCEILERLHQRPVFILTANGKHAVLGAWACSSTNFPNRQPVCKSADQMAKMVDNHELRVLDVNCALQNIGYKKAKNQSSWAHIGRGFVHAVDITTTRGWWKDNQFKFEIPPLPRVYDSFSWVYDYLWKRLPRYLERQTEQAWLDDPGGLFIPITCHITGGTIHTVLEPGGKTGWLPGQVIEQAGRVVLLADGGAGKSYICRRVVLDLVERFEKGNPNDLPVPIFYPLRFLVWADKDNLLGVLANWIGCPGVDDLISAANRYRFLFILDALDESEFGKRSSAPGDYVKLLQPVIDLPQCSVILTARPAMFPGPITNYLPGFNLANLQGWDQQTFSKFLHACETIKGIQFHGGWQQFYQRIFGPNGSRNLQDLAKTPLFARMIVETREEIDHDSNVRDEFDLYRRYTWHCFARREIVAIPPDEAHEASVEIAFGMYARGKDALENDEIVNCLTTYIAKRSVDIFRQFIARDVVVSGLLVKEGENLFRFSHLSIEHYFLAEYLAKELIRSYEEPVSPPGLHKISGVFGHALLPQSVIAFLSQAIKANSRTIKELATGLTSCPFYQRRRMFYHTRQLKFDPDVAFRNMVLLHLQAGESLEECDLQGLDLINFDLSRADLRRCNLKKTKLRGCTLLKANLAGCYLNLADLSETDLTEADLSGADLDRCILSHIRVRDFNSLPKFCGVNHLDTIELDNDDPETVWLLVRCISHCEQDPNNSDWVNKARAVLKERLKDKE